MDSPSPRGVPRAVDTYPPVCILLTSYGTGAGAGKKLGVAGYSHDIVAKIYRPLLEQIGRVVLVDDAQAELIPLAEQARREGLFPLQFSVTPFQDVFLPPSFPSIVAPAWEFPDVPDHMFAGNPQNDWPATADRCARVIVSGRFTADALRRGGATVPIDLVQVPVADGLFQVPLWDPSQTTELHCRHIVLNGRQPGHTVASPFAERDAVPQRTIDWRAGMRSMARSVYRMAVRPVIGDRLARSLRDALRVGRLTWQAYQNVQHHDPRLAPLSLSGVVYTSIFNPNDGRKNWHDLLTAFLVAMRDRPDVTLVVKLVTNDPVSVGRFVQWYHQRQLPHQCRVVVVTGYLSDEEMQNLIQASTFYYQATKAEGNCLPLMDYLAAGRPGISPNHSAMSDYFDERFGHVIRSSPEPAAWPHDPRGGIQTTWGRIDWSSIVEALHTSYHQATADFSSYQAMSRTAREHMAAWAGIDSVQPRLEQAIRRVIQESRHDGFPVNGEVERIAA